MKTDLGEEYSANVSILAKGTGINLIGSIGRGVLTFLFAIVVARLIGAQNYGLYAIALAITSIAGIAGQLGLREGVVRFVALYGGEKRPDQIKGTLYFAVKLSLTLSIGIALLIMAASRTIALVIFHNPELAVVLFIMAAGIPFFVLAGIFAAFTQGFRVMRYKTFVQDLMQPSAELILAVLLILFGWLVLGPPVGYVASMAISVVLLLYYSNRIFPLFGSDDVAFMGQRDLLRFSFPLLLANLLEIISLRLSPLMLGSMMGATEAGIYSIVLQFTHLVVLFLGSFNIIFAPIISDLSNRGELDQLGRLFKFSAKWLLLISFPLFVGIAFFAGPILSLFGDEFMQGEQALVVLCLAALINVGTGSVGYLLAMSGYSGFTLANVFSKVVLTVVLSLVLIPRYGLLGAAIAQGVGIVVLNLLALVQVRHLMRIHPYSRSYLKSILAVLVSSVFVFGLTLLVIRPEDFRVSLSCFVLFLLLYCSALFLIGLEDEEKNLAAESIERIRQSLKGPAGIKLFG